jgi:hypothetical protein
MAIITDYEAASNLVEPGEYECRIVEALVDATPRGSLFFSVRLVIRDDVAQKHQKRLLFYRIYRRREPDADDMKTDGFSFRQIMNLCRAAQLPNGKSYESLDELGNDLAGACVKVKVAHEFNDYRGENECVIKWVNKSDETPARGKKGSVSDLALENENTGGDFSPADDDLPWK